MNELDWKDVTLGGLVIVLIGTLVLTGHADALSGTVSVVGSFICLLLTPKKAP